MKVLVTGASGLLGRAVYSHFVAQHHEVLGLANTRAASSTHLQQLDLLDTDALRETLQGFRPDVVVHTAAERRPDVVERDPKRCQELNADVPGRIAGMCKELDKAVRVIYISTDYVFDGSKPPYQVDSEPNPLNAYGTSKLLGERSVAVHGQKGMTTSLRVPVLYGQTTDPSESAVNVLLTAILPPPNGAKRAMDAHAVRYPTNVADLARVIESIVRLTVAEDKHLPPILHYQAMEAMTKYDMCHVLVRLQNRNSPPLPEASVAHLEPEYEIDPMAATSRPRHCKLDITLLQEMGVDTRHTPFESWWAEELERQAAQITDVAEQGGNTNILRYDSHGSETEPNMHQSVIGDTTVDNRVEIGIAGGAECEDEVQPEGDSSSSSGELAASDSRSTTVAASPAISRASAPSFPHPPIVPASPNPSFSSLQARPTPPGTSDIQSPNTSQEPSLRNAEGVVLAPDRPADPAVRPHDGPYRHDNSTDITQPKISNSDASTESVIQTPNNLSSAFRKDLTLPSTEDLTEQPLQSSEGDSSQEDPPPAALNTDDDLYGQASPRSQDHGVPSVLTTHSSLKDGNPSNLPVLPDAEAGSGLPTQGKDAGQAFQIKVGDPHKVGESVTGHILYTVRTQTNAPGFRAAQFSVLRRYSDFRWLHAALVHTNPGIIIPPVPEKVRGLISRFSPDLVEARRHGLEKMINKVANHPALASDDDLKLFLESEDFSRDVKLRDARKGAVPTPEAKTWMGWSGTVSINSGHKFHEQDEWFDRQSAYLDSLEAQLKHMVKSINVLAQSRKDLADAIAAHSHALLMLSGSSLSRSLSACFAGLGDLHRRAQELEDLQGDSDLRHFGSVLNEYERVVGSVRKAFSTRIDNWHLMQKADEDFRRIRNKHDKVKRETSATHYHEESLKDLAEAETLALERRANFDLVSRRIKGEMNRFDHERVLELRTAIDMWLGEQILRREELLEEWYHYSEKCLSLDLSERSKFQAVSSSSHQGTVPDFSLAMPDNARRILTTSPPSSELSRFTSAGRVKVDSANAASNEPTGYESAGKPNQTITGILADAGRDQCRRSDDSIDGFQQVDDSHQTITRAEHDDTKGRDHRTAGKHSAEPADQLRVCTGRSTSVERLKEGNVSSNTFRPELGSSPLYVGSRLVQVQPHPARVRYGTVRYIGPVTTMRGQWLGVEWDWSKGKHDGEVEGERYFTCSRAGNVASFIRPPSHSGNVRVGGVPFVAALEARYIGQIPPVTPNRWDVATRPYSRRTLADIEIEVPNLDKVSHKVQQLTRLKTVALNGPVERSPLDVEGTMSVNSATELLSDCEMLVGDVGSDEENADADARRLAERVPNIVRLDLSSSLLSSWSTVGLITRYLTKLEVLYLHRNRLPRPSSERDPQPGSLATLAASAGLQCTREFGLHCTGVDWAHICEVANYMPSLETLQLTGNGILRLSLLVHDSKPVPPFMNLREINLSHNHLADWCNIVEALGQLPLLERLVLANNNIAVIPFPVGSRKVCFPRLQSISISGNPMFDILEGKILNEKMNMVWSSLYALDQWLRNEQRTHTGLHALTAHLSNSEVPCIDSPATSVEDPSPLRLQMQHWRFNVIARLPDLSHFNGTEVTPRQRSQAEEWWLSSLAEQVKLESRIEATRESCSVRTEEEIVKDIQSRELRWAPLRQARSRAPPSENAQTEGTHTLRADLLSLTVHLSTTPPSSCSAAPTPLKTISSFAAPPTLTLKAARPRILKSLGIATKLLTRGKVHSLQDGEDGERWYGVIAGSDANGGRHIFEIDDDMRELAWWGFEEQQQTGATAGEIWVCFPPDVLESVLR